MAESPPMMMCVRLVQVGGLLWHTAWQPAAGGMKQHSSAEVIWKCGK
jgi:hypothetical protein